MSNSFSFDILKLEKWSSSLGEYGPLRELTKMQSRRMTSVGKKTIDLALSCTKNEKVDFVVYSSRHGELNLSYDLIKSFLADDTPSPMKFSQSTHNAIAGLYCIQSKRKVPVTALSAGKDSFKMGLVAVYNHLKAHSKHNVLFMFSEAKVPEIYTSKINDPDEDRVLCALMKQGDKFKFEITESINDLNI